LPSFATACAVPEALLVAFREVGVGVCAIAKNTARIKHLMSD